MKYRRIMSLLASAVMVVTIGTEAVAAEGVQTATPTQATSTSSSDVTKKDIICW